MDKAPEPNPPTWSQALVYFVENLHTGLAGRDGHTGAFHDCAHPQCRDLQQHVVTGEIVRETIGVAREHIEGLEREVARLKGEK